MESRTSQLSSRTEKMARFRIVQLEERIAPSGFSLGGGLINADIDVKVDADVDVNLGGGCPKPCPPKPCY